jgi:hypothetical protein
VDRRSSLGLMILGLASYSSELSLSFGAAILAAGLATVMNERMQAIHRNFAFIQNRNADIEQEYCLLFGGEDDSDSDTPFVRGSNCVFI